ncbi:MAG: FliA/WhiG family RNA polymerase sigma factor [Verrucomicrobiota bacterium]
MILPNPTLKRKETPKPTHRRGVNTTVTNREETISSFLPLVHRIVDRSVYFVPPGLEYQDLVSAGVTGLVQAVDRYSPQEGASLKTYVSIRIRGAILDELRRNNLTSRQTQSLAKQLSEAQLELAQALGREPTEDELCAEMGLSRRELASLLERTRPIYLTSLDLLPGHHAEDELQLQDILSDPNSVDPSERVEQRDDVALVRSLLEQLNPQQLQVIKLYYLDGLRGKDIARKLKLTESRISQLHTLALSKLRAAFHAARK